MTTARLVRRIAARPDIVFDALVTADDIRAWWGPDDLPATSAVSEPRVGGAFEVRFHTADGREHVCTGEFLELVRPERVVLSWRWTSGGDDDERGRVSRVEFHLRAIDAGTELTLVHGELSTDASARNHDGGWAGALTKLTRRLGGRS
jgi:uncharacterized protein YndB with AHSA1/START domain|nr:SRPBCC domain-containing protein [Kofleriaceae bacterium]